MTINDLDAQWVANDMIHARPYERSDNGILFSIEWAILDTLLMGRCSYERKQWFIKLALDHTDNLKQYWQAPWVKQKDPASHDNNTAMLSMAFALEQWQIPVNFRILGQHWHPRDIIFYNYIKAWSECSYRGKHDMLIMLRGMARLSVTYLFWWLILPIMVQSCWKQYKVRNDKKIVHTDGKLLTFVRCQCLRHKSWLMDITFKLCTKILKRHTGIADENRGMGYANLSTWEKCFQYYFPYHDHPCVIYSAWDEWKVDYSRTPNWTNE